MAGILDDPADDPPEPVPDYTSPNTPVDDGTRYEKRDFAQTRRPNDDKRTKVTYAEDDEPFRCRAMSKQNDRRCKQHVVKGKRVCHYHGGHNPGGPIKHGRYSKTMGRFREAYEDSKNDPSLLDLRETMALLDVVVKRSAEWAAENDTPEFRSRALSLFEHVRAVEGTEEYDERMDALGAHLEAGGCESSALENLAVAAERLSKRQERAWGIRLDAAQAVNARDLVVLLGQFADIVLQEAPKIAAARIVQRIDIEIMGTGAAAIGLETGSPTGGSVQGLRERPGGVYDGHPGVDPVDEAS
jgi:hypothetical protein